MAMLNSKQGSAACIEAWLLCEKLLIYMHQSTVSFAQYTRQVVEECAHICLGTYSALENGVRDMHQLALLCMGICEECADVCARYIPDEHMADCAAACRRCSSVISSFAVAAV